MVARITSGSNLSGVLKYNADKVNRGEADLLLCNRVIDMERPDRFNLTDAMQSFAPYLAVNRRTKNPVFHVSLNPAVTDCLTDAQLTEIAREYMERMGFGDQPYYVFKHRDIDRETDVLSFPLGDDENGYEVDPDTDAIMLGDIVISLEKAKQQAEEYGHSYRREVAFLLTHSLFHLLGYDHENGGLEAMRMREKEEAVLTQLGLPRTVSYTE